MTAFYSLASSREGGNVLNPFLYRVLLREFNNRVTVANPGEPFSGTVGIGPNGLPQVRTRHAGEYYRVNCPFCPDTKKRLWINHYFGQLGPNNRPLTHLAICYKSNCLERYQNRQTLTDRLLGMVNSRERRTPMPLALPTTSREAFTFEPPGDIEPLLALPDNHPAVQYMIRRRYSREMIQAFEIGYVVRAVPKYRAAENRIYFPIRMHGELVGWQTRYVSTDQDAGLRERGIPKYYSLPGMPKRDMLYNYDNALACPFVLVLEGPTDVHRLGRPAVAVMGKTLSGPQQQLLVTGWVGKPIIFVFDPGAEEDMQGVVADLARERRTAPVIGIELPAGGDPGDWDAAALWTFIYQRAAVQNVHLARAL